MFSVPTNITSTIWSNSQKFLFRIVVLYFLLQIIPVDWKFYKEFFSVKWTTIHYSDIFNLAHYTPQLITVEDSFINIVPIFLIALVAAIIWDLVDKNKVRDFDVLYYWLRVLLRYRLAVALLAYGFIKLFPLQFPYPSLSNLNTNYGDFNRWKLFSLGLGIVPHYESFLGFTEIMLAIGLLYRKTASIASLLIIIFLGNVFISNIAYEGGECIYSFLLLSMALFILLFDMQRIVNLLILQKPTAPNRFKPVFVNSWQKYGRWVLKVGFILFFVVIYGFKTRNGYYKDRYQYPRAQALQGIDGLYNVAEFVLNNDTIAYSKTDTQRWNNIIFEKWNTVSIASNREIILDIANSDKIYKEDKFRIYELMGSGGRHYYSYEVDTVNYTMKLHNRNPNYLGETFMLEYNHLNDSTIILKGVDQNKNSVLAKLEKINKIYLLQNVQKHGRGRKLKL